MLETYPKVSILSPVYNRPEFLSLMIDNILNQKYDKDKLEWVILDDGEIPLSDSPLFNKIKELIKPVKLNYTRLNTKQNVGNKRNKLCKLASHKILINMDDDDIYLPDYIKYSVETLESNKLDLVGSNSMLIIYPYKNYDISIVNCKEKRQIHEGTMCFRKKLIKSSGGFSKSKISEGASIIDNTDSKRIGLTNIESCMIQTAHKNNSYPKDIFHKNIININEDPVICKKIKILREIFKKKNL